MNKKNEFDEGKDLKDATPAEVFLFAMQGFIYMGELLLAENKDSKAQFYIEPANEMVLKLSSMLEFEPEHEHYSYESLLHCLYDIREEERKFAVKMVLEFMQGIETTMTKNPILASQRPNVLRNYEIIAKMVEELNKRSINYKKD